MTLRIAINGFGRIGRLVARALYESKGLDIELVAINDPGSNFVSLYKYDSVHGTVPYSVAEDAEGNLIIDGNTVKMFHERDPANIDWASVNVDIVMECSGFFRKREQAMKHIQAGAKKVLISAPAEGEDLTVVYGVNSDKLASEHVIVSNASCTTNCLAPVAFALHNAFGIERGFMTTIHSYTGDQCLVDSAHSDPLRARAAAINMIPTSTGAAKAVGKVLPELNGKLDGVAIRVPTPNVSLVDFKFTAARDVTEAEVNQAITAATTGGSLEGILTAYDDPCVSMDFNHNPHSSIFSLDGTKVIDGRFVRVMSWYDNEWGFSNRMLQTALKMHAVGYTAQEDIRKSA